MRLHYLFIDMNAFFAAVEQQERPELRGQPIGIVPVMAETTSLIAASYEAKKHGVTTGTPVYEARRRCPGIRFVQARPELYIRIHHQIVEAVTSCLPVTEVMSIDEMVCKLLGKEQEWDAAQRLGRQVKAAIRKQVGDCLRCSVGLATNRMLAKVAADMQKPDGLTMICQEDLPQRLYDLQLTDFPGIGKQMHQRLRRCGITCVRQLCELSVQHLSEIWGSKILGAAWWHHLRGDDVAVKPTKRRTLGHSHVLAPQLRNTEGAKTVLLRLIHKAGARLRRINYWTGAVALSVSYRDAPSFHAERRIDRCQDTLTLIEALVPLWERRPPGPPLKVGIVLGELSMQQETAMPLFPEDRDRVALAKAMDEVNGKFGAHSVYFGGMFGAQHAAPRRIAFTSIPSLHVSEE
jgi:DNA polymerase IV